MNNTEKASNIWEEKSTLILTVLLIVFALAKLVHLYTPLFHDELPVYGRAMFYMIDHGSSMLPGGMPPELSRGHPPFYVFFMSLTTKLFGGTYYAARFVSLLVSLCLLCTTYWLGKEMFDKKIGLMSAILLSVQPLFFAQSTMILPEVMLGLLGMLSILFYLKQRYLLYFIFAGLLILTKETGIIIFAGIALNEWYRERFRINLNLIGRCLKYSAPVVCILLYFVMQKQVMGWYLYPYHTGFISFHPADVCSRFFLGFALLFYDQGRFLLSIAAFVIIVKASKGGRREFMTKNMLALFCVLMFFAFSSLNYFMARYQLVIFPLLMISLLSILTKRITKVRYFLIYVLMTLPFHYNFTTFRTDDNMNYLISVESLKKCVAKLDSIINNESVVVFGMFPEVDALIDTRYGYTTNPDYVLVSIYHDTCQYIIRGGNYPYGHELFKEEPIDSVLYYPDKLNQSPIEQLYEHQHYFSNFRLYKTNNPDPVWKTPRKRDRYANEIDSTYKD